MSLLGGYPAFSPRLLLDFHHVTSQEFSYVCDLQSPVPRRDSSDQVFHKSNIVVSLQDIWISCVCQSQGPVMAGGP